MANSGDHSGQVLLTNAILMAIVIVIIALMLNNIIYATNVAYIGFMDGSKYEDASIKQMTIKEATNSYNYYSSDSAARNAYMTAYQEQLNLLTNSKGKYVDLRQTTSSLTPSFTTQTAWTLAITSKDTSVKYTILTGMPNAPVPPAPTKPTVTFGNAPYIVNEGEGVQVTAVLSNEYLTDTVSVNYATAPGTATPANYVDKTGTLTFSPGDTSETFTITTIDDGVYTSGPARTFTITLTPSTNADGSAVTETVSIVDINPTPVPPPTVEEYDMEIVGFTATYSGNKNVVVTAAVKNTGTKTLQNVRLHVVLPEPKPGNTLSEFVIGDLAAGATSASNTWTYEMKNQNDKTAKVQATSTQIITDDDTTISSG